MYAIWSFSDLSRGIEKLNYCSRLRTFGVQSSQPQQLLSSTRTSFREPPSALGHEFTSKGPRLFSLISDIDQYQMFQNGLTKSPWWKDSLPMGNRTELIVTNVMTLIVYNAPVWLNLLKCWYFSISESFSLLQRSKDQAWGGSLPESELCLKPLLLNVIRHPPVLITCFFLFVFLLKNIFKLYFMAWKCSLLFEFSLQFWLLIISPQIVQNCTIWEK